MFQIDWSQFIPSVIATLIGFFLAIVFQQFIYEKVKDNIKNNKSAKSSIEKIIDELNTIISTLEEIDEKKLYIDPIKTPVWTACLNTNEIVLLSDFLDKKNLKKEIPLCNNKEIDICKRLFVVYGTIDEYNKWWNLASEQKINENENCYDSLLKLLDNIKKKLCDETFNEDSAKGLSILLKKIIKEE